MRGTTTREDVMKKIPTWTTRTGKVMKLADMEASHLQNCIRIIRRGQARREQEVVSGYQMLGFVSGEYAQLAIESDLNSASREAMEYANFARFYIQAMEAELKKRAGKKPERETDYAKALAATAKAFPVGCTVRLKNGPHTRQRAKVERHYKDIVGGVKLDVPLNEHRSWNIKDLRRAVQAAEDLQNSGDGARVKKARVVDDNDKVVWAYGKMVK